MSGDAPEGPRDRAEAIRGRRLAQPLDELRRKAGKSRSKSNLYTQEELDHAKAKAEDLHANIVWE